MSGLGAILRPTFGVVARALIAAAVVLVLVLAWLLGPVETVARGWLVAFAIWSGVPIGSLVLLMIHRLTGGIWGQALAPVLRPSALLTPLVALAFLPVLLALPAVYPWAADAARASPSVAKWYLNGPAFLIRTGVALAGWSVLGVLFGLGRGGRLLAGLGLAFHGLAISLIAIDWFLSLDPGYVSTAFAAMIAIQQMLAALAFAALVGPSGLDDRVAADVGGLLIAMIAGVFYLELMTFIIAWYGDQPDGARWYGERVAGGWVWQLGATILVGAAVPFFGLLLARVRDSRVGVRVAGALVLGGTALHFLWLLIPGFEAQAGPILVACLAAAALAVAAIAAGLGAAPHRREARHGA